MHANDAVPIACTLEGANLASRLAELRRFTERSLASHRLKGRVLKLSYRRDAELDLRRIVELERACCGFLTLGLDVQQEAVILTITAPESATESAAWLFDQFMPAPTTKTPVAACGCAQSGSCP
jgi:hypothetical protein